ncbi:MAG: arylesterase [Rhodobacteraceae bacterium]|nr:arylesterase [Paracoccaceae bacterium]
MAPPAYGARARVLNLAAAALMLAGAASCAAAAEPVTIAALGDSLTQGYGLPEAEGFAPLLQAWLRENGAADAVVINAGVSGDTTAGGRARVAWTLTEDVDAVIVALGGNDLLRGLDPTESRRNLDAILAEVVGRGLPVLLAGLPAPANYGAEYQAAFDAIYPELAAQHDAILYPNFLAGLGAGSDLNAARALMQPDGIHPNAEGVTAVVAAIGPSVLELVAAAQQD